MKAALRTLVGLLVVFLLLGWALSADGAEIGTSLTVEQWEQEMNQESYWEDRFGAECTKFEGHSGFIPVPYDFVIVKAGQYVSIFGNVPAGYTVYDAAEEKEISWVTKCKIVETTTTTSTPTSTTTTVVETTTTTVRETTTTSEATTSTTEAPTTTVPEVTTTTVVVTTTTSEPPEELPYTGTSLWLFPLGLVLAASGGFLVRKYREPA
jgi:LPXTG-motif cell wall-anchored protein